MSSTKNAEEQELAAQARSVAESILASPKTLPQQQQQVVGGLDLLKGVEAPSAMFDNLKITDTKELTKEVKSEKQETTGPVPDQCNLFVGDLARSVTQEQIREVFSKHGEVLTVDIKRDKITNNSLGYGFVQFETKEQAAAAKQFLNGVEIGNRKIRLGWAQKNTTLFIGDLDPSVTVEDLKNLFGRFGPLVEDETFIKSSNTNKIFGFVRFKVRADAERAKSEMNRKPIGNGVRAVRIGWGDSNIQKHCVHVQFNPAQGIHLTEDDFRTPFGAYGEVISVSLPRYTNHKLKGYGFIHYKEDEEGEKSAGSAISKMSETKVGHVTIRCSYGKRQTSNRRKNKFKNMQRQPMYQSAWVMGPNGQWHSVPVGPNYQQSSQQQMQQQPSPYYAQQAPAGQSPAYYPQQVYMGQDNSSYPNYGNMQQAQYQQVQVNSPTSGVMSGGYMRQQQGQANMGYQQQYNSSMRMQQMPQQQMQPQMSSMQGGQPQAMQQTYMQPQN